MWKKVKISNLIIIAVGVLLVATIVFGVKAAAQGEKLLALEDKASELVSQDQEIQDQIVSYQSLTNVSKKANDLGMIKPEKFLYMSNQGIALR